MWQVAVKWTNPYTKPPEGKPVTLKVFIENTACKWDWINKDEIFELSNQPGYNIGLTKIRETEIKKKVFSEEAKLNLRKKHCVRRVAKKYHFS